MGGLNHREYQVSLCLVAITVKCGAVVSYPYHMEKAAYSKRKSEDRDGEILQCWKARFQFLPTPSYRPALPAA